MWRRHRLHQPSSCMNNHHLLYTRERLPLSFVLLKKKKKINISKRRRVLKLLIDLSNTGVMCCCSRKGQDFYFFFVSLFVTFVPKCVPDPLSRKSEGTSSSSRCSRALLKPPGTCSIKLCRLYPPPSPDFYLEFFNPPRCVIAARALLLLPIIGLVLLNRKFHYCGLTTAAAHSPRGEEVSLVV